MPRMTGVMSSLTTKKLRDFTRFPTVTTAFTWSRIGICPHPLLISVVVQVLVDQLLSLECLLAITCLKSETDDPESSINSTDFPQMHPLTVAILLLTAATTTGTTCSLIGGLILWWDVCCPELAPRWSFPEFENNYVLYGPLPQLKQRGGSRWS